MIVSPLSNKPSRWLALSFGIVLSCSASLFAADLTWDGNVTSNWDTSTENWSGPGITWNNTTPDNATFGTTGVGTIVLDEDIVAGNLTFNTTGYTISTTGGNLTINNGINANESATINGANPLILGAANTWQVADSKILTIATGVNGPHGFTKTGTGELTLSTTASTYTGETLVQAGILRISANNVSSGFTISNGARLVIVSTAGNFLGDTADVHVEEGGVFEMNKNETMGGLSGAGNLEYNTNGTFGLVVGNGVDGSTTFSGDILQLQSGTLNFTKAGTGNLTLSGNNNYTGTTTINAGILRVDSADVGTTSGALGVGGDIKFSGGTLQYTANSASTDYSSRIKNSGSTIILNTNGSNVTLGGNIDSSNTRGLTKLGTGNLTLSGNNTYSGTTTISEGTLIVGNGAAIADTGRVNIANEAGATLQLNADEAIGSLSGGGAAGGTVDLQTHTLTVGGDDSDRTFSGDITGSGGLTKTGSGTFTLSGESFHTYTGDTLVEEGKLTLREDTETSSFTIRNGATLQFAGTAGDFIADTSDIQIDAGGTVILSKTENMGSLTGAGDFIMRSGSDRTLSVNPGSADTVFSGNMSETLAGKLNFTKNGTGTLTLSGTNTTTGKITVNAGTLQFGKQVSLFNGNTSLWTTDTLDIRNGTTAAFNVGGIGEFTSTDIATLSALGTAGGGFRSGSTIGLDTTNASGGVFTYSNVIANPNGGSNNLGLNKLGTGTLELTEANTYTRGTTVTAGTLLANNPTGSATGTGAVTVKLGATLGGNGSITGPTTIESGGLHTAGTTSSASTLTHGDVTYEKGATVTWNLLSNSTSMDFDQFNTGALNFSTTNDDDVFITLDFSGTVNFHDDFWRDGVTNENEWKIWDYSSLGSTFGDTEFVLSLTGSASGLPIDASAFEIWDNNYDGNDAGIWLRQTSAVPEPSTYALMSLGLAAFGWHVRRRRKSAAGPTTKKR